MKDQKRKRKRKEDERAPDLTPLDVLSGPLGWDRTQNLAALLKMSEKVALIYLDPR